MALDLAPYNIRVNTIIPGYIHTSRWDDLTEAQVERRHKNIPLAAEAQADDIARVAVFLASDEARLITGSQVTIDGGVSIQLVPSDTDV
jgi:3-oxoacyl-[acyl-carrier protein] reductase